MTTKAAAPGQGENGATGAPARSEPLMLRKRIGSTTFLVSVHSSETSTETLEDKVLRLLEREVDKVA